MRKLVGLITALLVMVSTVSVAFAIPPSHAGGPPPHVCEGNPGHWSCDTTTTTTVPTTTTTDPTTTTAPSTTTTTAPTTTSTSTTSTSTSTTTTTTTPSTTTTTLPPTTTTTTTPPSGSCSGINVTPSTNLQTAINNASTGATFCFAPGTYFIPATLRPKSSQQFISTTRRTAILTGNNSTNMAFNGDGSSNVLVQGFIIENFNVTQEPGWAALKGATGWSMIDNEVRNNNGLGIYHGAYSLVKDNNVHHNAHVGLGGYKAHYTVIEGNEVWENGYNGLRDNTGSKWTGCVGCVFRDNHYHHNYNNAVWFDGDNLNILIENNVISDNYGKGVHYEISCQGTIRNNLIERNGDMGLLVVASQDLSVYQNVIADNRLDFEVWYQERGAGDNCAWTLNNVRVFDNDIRITRERSGIFYCCGGSASVYNPGDTRIRFDNNRYEIGIALPFFFDHGLRTVAEWQGYGQDPNSTFVFVA